VRSSTVLLITTVASVVLILFGTVALGEPPSASAGGPEVAAWFATQGTHARVFTWALTLLVPLTATSGALIRARLPAPHRDVFLVGLIVFLADTTVSGWLWAGLSWHADRLQPATARTLLDVASFWGPVLNGATISMLAPVTVLSWGHRPVLPRWLGVLGAVALAEQCIETVTVFGRTGFIAPGGPMNIYLGASLVTLWMLCLGITLSRRPVPRAGRLDEDSTRTAPRVTTD
jgi:hypothetical protein